MKLKTGVLVVVLGSLLILPAQSQAQSFFNVKAQAASTSSLAGPVKWTGDATWFVLDQGFHSGVCVLYVWPYGATIPNGWIEFPGNYSTPGTLANWCLGVPEWATICVDGEILSEPDTFGQTVRISGARYCW